MVGQYCPLLVVFSSGPQPAATSAKYSSELKRSGWVSIFGDPVCSWFASPSTLAVAPTSLHKKSRFDQEEEDDPSKQEGWRLTLPGIPVTSVPNKFSLWEGRGLPCMSLGKKAGDFEGEMLRFPPMKFLKLT